MTGERSYTTKIWLPPSSIGFSSAGVLSTSMDPPGEPVISTWRKSCPQAQTVPEFPEPTRSMAGFECVFHRSQVDDLRNPSRITPNLHPNRPLPPFATCVFNSYKDAFS